MSKRIGYQQTRNMLALSLFNCNYSDSIALRTETSLIDQLLLLSTKNTYNYSGKFLEIIEKHPTVKTSFISHT